MTTPQTLKCPICGKTIPAYRSKAPYCDCGWQGVAQAETPPTPEAKVSHDALGSTLQVIGKQASNLGEWALAQGERVGLVGLLKQKSFYFFLIWAGITLFPFLESERLLVGRGWLCLIPLGLSLATLVASARNIAFPVHLKVSPILLRILLFASPFLQTVNVSGVSHRPYWTSIAWWIAAVLILCSIFLKSFSLGLVAFGVALASFCTLLF
jgi:hypothetical protein